MVKKEGVPPPPPLPPSTPFLFLFSFFFFLSEFDVGMIDEILRACARARAWALVARGE